MIPDEEVVRPLADSLGSALRLARIRRHMTQKQLSAASGIAQGDISRLEHGQACPTIRTIARLAQALGTHVVLELLEKETKCN